MASSLFLHFPLPPHRHNLHLPLHHHNLSLLLHRHNLPLHLHHHNLPLHLPLPLPLPLHLPHLTAPKRDRIDWLLGMQRLTDTPDCPDHGVVVPSQGPDGSPAFGRGAGGASVSGGFGAGLAASTKRVLTHGGRYAQYKLYNVFGNLFEVSIKYVPPIRPIGRGAYGIVCAAVNADTHEEVAIKKIGNAFVNIIDAKRTLREIKLLSHMDHENVISIKDIVRPPKKETFNDAYIVYELMDGTDLHQIIRSEQALTDDHCQLLRGLKYVRSANVLHRDLKTRNLLLNANCDLKIGDFGLARTTYETDFMTEYVVTRWYRAPELLLNCSEYTAAIGHAWQNHDQRTFVSC